jgi:outer membrane protein assembly factor BamB
MISTGAKASYAYDPLTGKELWRVDYTGFSNAARPVAGGGLAYVNTGYGKADLIAVRLGGSGDVSSSHVAWRITKNVPLNPSPILLDGLLYLINSGGIFSCLDAKTGEEIWKERITGPFSASPVLADGKIYMFNEGGDGYICLPGRAFHQVAMNHLDDGLMSSPAVAGHQLILRTKSHLYCIEGP